MTSEVPVTYPSAIEQIRAAKTKDSLTPNRGWRPSKEPQKVIDISVKIKKALLIMATTNPEDINYQNSKIELDGLYEKEARLLHVPKKLIVLDYALNNNDFIDLAEYNKLAEEAIENREVALAEDDPVAAELKKYMSKHKLHFWRKDFYEYSIKRGWQPVQFDHLVQEFNVPRKQLRMALDLMVHTAYGFRMSPGQEAVAHVEEEGVARRYLNVYVKTDIVPKEGPVEDFIAVVKHLCSNNQGGLDFVLDWLSALFQSLVLENKVLRLHTILYFCGTQGTGKGVLAEVLKALLTYEMCSFIEPEVLHDKWVTTNFRNKLLVVFNELVNGSRFDIRAKTQSIKTWVTEDNFCMLKKNVDTEDKEPMYANFIAFSNYNDGIYLEEGDRRVVMFEQKSKLNEDLGKRLAEAAKQKDQAVLGPIYNFLLTRELGKWCPKGVDVKGGVRIITNPEDMQGMIYNTEAKSKAITSSRGGVDDFIDEFLNDGWDTLAYDWSCEQGNSKYYAQKSGDACPIQYIRCSDIRDVYRKQNGKLCSNQTFSRIKDAILASGKYIEVKPNLNNGTAPRCLLQIKK